MTHDVDFPSEVADGSRIAWAGLAVSGRTDKDIVQARPLLQYSRRRVPLAILRLAVAQASAQFHTR